MSCSEVGTPLPERGGGGVVQRHLASRGQPGSSRAEPWLGSQQAEALAAPYLERVEEKAAAAATRTGDDEEAETAAAAAAAWQEHEERRSSKNGSRCRMGRKRPQLKP